jgi:uncharacterized membrane protein
MSALALDDDVAHIHDNARHPHMVDIVGCSLPHVLPSSSAFFYLMIGTALIFPLESVLITQTNKAHTQSLCLFVFVSLERSDQEKNLASTN